MVSTRKTRQNKQTSSSSLDLIKNYNSEESDSDYKYISEESDDSDDSDYSDDSDSDIDDSFLFTRNELLLFDKALNSEEHWTDSDFYNYLYNKYIKHIFYFSKDQQSSPREWSDYMITVVNRCGQEDYDNLCTVQDIDSFVGKCFFRNQTRTLSKRVWFDGTDYQTGTRCAEMMLEMTRFFVMTENEMNKESNLELFYQKDYSLLSSILNKLENILVDFESD